VSVTRPSAAVRQVLEEYIDSFEKLEIALALHRAPARTLSIPELAAEVQLAEGLVERTVEELRGAGLVEVAGGLVRLAAEWGGGAGEAAVTELAELYDEDRVLVVRTLSELAVEKIRGMAARTFAELRKK
jgi:predicted transcriptional regulator